MNLDALDKWVGQVPGDVRADMAELAPMLSVLGYDPWANPPRYAAFDATNTVQAAQANKNTDLAKEDDDVKEDDTAMDAHPP